MHRLYKTHGLLLISTLIWGMTFSVSKFTLEFISPELLGMLRYIVAAIVMIVIGKILKVNFKIDDKVELMKVLLAGIIGLTGYAFFELKALEYLPGSITALFIGLIPIFAFLMEILLKKRKMSLLLVTIIILGIVSVLSIVYKDINFLNNIKGYIYISVAIISWMVYLFLIANSKVEPVVVVSYNIFTTAIILSAVYLFTDKSPLIINSTTVTSIIYLGIFATSISYYLYFRGLNVLGAGIASVYDNLVFVIGFFVSAIILNEVIEVQHVVSFIVILIAILLSFKLELIKK